MKTLIPLVIVAFLVALTPRPLAAQEANEFYQAALDLYQDGDVLLALQEVNYALRVEPDHLQAKALRRNIMARHGSVLEMLAQKKRLESTILPSVDLQDVSFNTALEYLREQTKKATNGKFVPNFVVRGDRDLNEVRVSLQLSAIPLSDTLRYLCDKAGMRYRPDKHAILIEPIPTANSSSEAAGNAGS